MDPSSIISSALSVITTIRSVSSTDSLLYHKIADLSDQASSILTETRDLFDDLDHEHQSRVARDVATINSILRQALAISTTFQNASLASRAYQAPDLVTQIDRLSSSLTSSTSSIKASIDACVLEVTGKEKAAIDALRTSLLNTLGNLVADKERVAQLIGLEDMSMEERNLSRGSTSRALSGVASPMGSLDRLYLEQKLSVLTNALVTLPEVPLAPGPVIVSSADVSYIPPTTAGNNEDAEDHVLQVLELLESLNTPTTLDQLADRLGELYLRVKTHFEMFELARAIIRVGVSLRRRAVAVDSSRQRRFLFGRSLMRLAGVTFALEEFEEALKVSLEAEEVLRELSSDEAMEEFGDYCLLYSAHLSNHSRYYYSLGRFTEAMATIEHAEVQYARLNARGYKDQSPFTVTHAVHARYMILDQLGRAEEAGPSLHALEGLALEWCANDTGMRDTMVTGVQTLALICLTAPPAEALHLLRIAHETLDRAFDFGDLSNDHTHTRHLALYALSMGYQQAGASDEAVRTARMSVPQLPMPQDALQQAEMEHAELLLHLSNLLFSASIYGECRTAIDDALSICERILVTRRPAIAATLAEALEVSALLRVHEGGDEGLEELDRAIGLWEEVKDEIPVRAKKGLERVIAARDLERANPELEPQLEVAGATEQPQAVKASRPKWMVWRKRGKVPV